MTASTASDITFRRTGIGGSDAPPVLGFPLYGQTAWHVYLSKIGQAMPLVATERMELGQWLEDPVAKRWAKETGHRVQNARTHVDAVTGMRTRAIRRADRPWMFAHCDRFDDEGNIVEVKVVNAYRTHEFGEPGSDQIPAGIALQVHHQLACVPSAKQAHVAVLAGGDRLLRFVIPRDPETIASIEAIEADFWNEHVIPRIPPELDGSDAATDYLRATYPTDDGTELVATDDLEELVSQYSIARQMRENHAEEEEVLKQRVIEAIGDASRLVGQRFTISYKLAKGYDVTDYKAVVSEVRPSADVLARYTSLREGVRRFVYTPKEGA